MIEEIIAFLGRDAMIAAHPAYGQGYWFDKVVYSLTLHLHASAIHISDWDSTLDSYEGKSAGP